MNPKTNVVKYVERLGLESICVSDNIPYFFMFIELDTKDKVTLRSTLKYLLNQSLAVLFFESNNGYHIISPSMIHLQQWLRMCDISQQIYPNHFYKHDVIRLSSKAKDGKVLFWENGDTRNKFKVSDDLLKLFELRFKTKINCPNRVKTSLIYTKYEDLDIT